MYKIKIVFFLIIISVSSFAANDRLDLAVSSIPDSLKKNAYGVVRFSNTEFEYKSDKNGIEKHSIAITILDKKGKEMADFKYSGDKYRLLNSLSGKLYDANGKFLRKYKLSDVISTNWSSSLASDDKHYFLSCETPSFPFTIYYEYEINWKNGILSFPAFFPQDDYNLSVENSKQLLVLPKNIEFSSKAMNIASEPKITVNKEIANYEWTVGNLKAIESENFDPNIDNYLPLIYIRPNNFVYDDVPGSIKDWESLGKWEYGLINNRDILTDIFKSKIIELTKKAKSDREKVKILYDYLGQTTRYVSIQLGIGGYQPMYASEVCKTGFGDCKALSNYMKAMLNVIGIPSNYTCIKLDMKRKTLYKEYANFNQMNHVILQVPLAGDTLWLECTNPRVPFGFVHNSIAGHDALVVNEQGGKVVRLPDYPDSLNIEKNCAILALNSDGSAKVTMQKQCQVKIYDNYDWFPLAKSTAQADNLREDINLPNVIIGDIKVKEDKSSLPSLTIDYSWTTSQYGNKTGNRLFIPINPFQTTYEWMKKKKRVHDMVINMGHKNIDSIYIPIPEGFEIEMIPTNNSIATNFGHFESVIKIKGNGIQIQQSVFMPAGKYNVSTYPEFVAFFEKLSTAYKGKIIFRKRTV
ncbi:MAG TPA: DUF3857 domain-containing protein [Paludibacter sp.]